MRTRRRRRYILRFAMRRGAPSVMGRLQASECPATWEGERTRPVSDSFQDRLVHPLEQLHPPPKRLLCKMTRAACSIQYSTLKSISPLIAASVIFATSSPTCSNLYSSSHIILKHLRMLRKLVDDFALPQGEEAEEKEEEWRDAWMSVESMSKRMRRLLSAYQNPNIQSAAFSCCDGKDRLLAPPHLWALGGKPALT